MRPWFMNRLLAWLLRKSRLKTDLFTHFEATFSMAWPHKENLYGMMVSSPLQDLR